MVKLEIKADNKDIESVKKLVETAINSEIKNLQRSLTKTEKILEEFEVKYKTTSELFLTNYTAEDLQGGDEEYIQWFGEIKIKEKLISSLQKLQNIEYVS
ncbi:hypothetical protein H6G11_14600 [Cyanobacterium aponinum FACHB-4101]|uniref:hypothetical protein n=1 Tax=Cyanobacterium aponinum TaxID=379064 RepID=UPI001681963B|nr:hypothetical protein [Cyanobacterium aponinum]MBD2395480.1 hypothetical protein [Cyanobacterium aponinum FACHB-4101]